MDYFGFAYAIAIGAGGVIGYVKAGSLVSLGMGLLFGGLSAVGAYQISQNENNYTVLLCTSGFLALMMGYRAFHSGKFMPAGLIAFLSVIMLVRLMFKIFK